MYVPRQAGFELLTYSATQILWNSDPQKGIKNISNDNCSSEQNHATNASIFSHTIYIKCSVKF